MSASDTGELTEQLIKYALELGLTRAKVIKADDIVVREEVISVGCAGCPEYGNNLMCPPVVPPPAEFLKTLSTYSKGILMQLTAELQSDPSEVGYGEAYLQAVRLHFAVCAVESRGRVLGFLRSTGYIAGCCRLCGACPGMGEKCRNPEKARSSMEANGINVIETCANVGWKLQFPVSKKVAWTGLVLLD